MIKELPYVVSEESSSELNNYLSNNPEFNDEYVFFVDLSLPSSKHRYFVINLLQDSIIKRGLVTHGSCSGRTASPNDRYSNKPDSYCSSLGKYRVGKSYQGKFGLAYKLHGLEESNNTAYERFIVLHAHECVPDNEVNQRICLSQGCPTVSPQFLSQLATYIDKSEKPILLWIKDDRI